MNEYRDISDFRLGYETGIHHAMEVIDAFYADEDSQNRKLALPLLEEIYAVFRTLQQPVYNCKICGEYRVENSGDRCANCLDTPTSDLLD